ncbi:hypothetical protein [Aeromonas phage 4L372D]|uniref:Uncharacterized protein n=2 Tax=Plateaulakevirus TaxID=2843436 RepID=A0A5B9N413_9CAUD|nr:hypothetical protein HWC25_gp163 [Aeromonas phage 2L372D]YP_009846728.1 hypothetical protein HWC27_gp211 [Aeromonas phage 4L372D]QDB74077.1 hypothetical protein 2L372D_163 [Aeromonas phage 2L372D]QEG08644.1 hypothetical protein [Aeromonas phage 4L372D]
MMAHFFSECGYTVIQLFGYRFQIVDRKRNPILSSSELPVFNQKELRVWRYGMSINKV